jgi:hypothetical protein
VKYIPAETTSYYFWKWADNDFYGYPDQVYAMLLRGEMPKAIQTFDARPLLEKLAVAAERGRPSGEEWEWQVYPPDRPSEARFVYATGPFVNDSEERVRWFSEEFGSLGLGGWDEVYGFLILCLKPKTNSVTFGQNWLEPRYEIQAEDLAEILSELNPKEPNPWLDFSNGTDIVWVELKKQSFRLRWKENVNQPDADAITVWSARKRDEEPAADRSFLQKLRPKPKAEILTTADVIFILEAFLYDEPMPEEYEWKQI